MNEHDQRNRFRCITDRVWSLSLVLGICIMIAGCTGVMVRVGDRPDIAVLEQSLEIGRSSDNDVRSLLGSPFGTGVAMLPFHDEPRDQWTYYYEEGSMTDDRRIFLFVYLKGSIYDGYMWFSSLPD